MKSRRAELSGRRIGSGRSERPEVQPVEVLEDLPDDLGADLGDLRMLQQAVVDEPGEGLEIARLDLQHLVSIARNRIGRADLGLERHEAGEAVLAALPCIRRLTRVTARSPSPSFRASSRAMQPEMIPAASSVARRREHCAGVHTMDS